MKRRCTATTEDEESMAGIRERRRTLHWRLPQSIRRPGAPGPARLGGHICTELLPVLSPFTACAPEEGSAGRDRDW